MRHGEHFEVRIESISLQFPSRCITNDDLVDQIRAANSDQNGPVVEKYCRTVRLLLRKAGSGTRFYRDLEADETAISIIKRAVTEALHIANLQPGDIDLLIYCG